MTHDERDRLREVAKAATPGPWEAYFSTGAGWSVRKKHERVGYTGLAPICSMAWFQFAIPGIIDDEISGANARLIAASPFLLARLDTAEGLLRQLVEGHPDNDGKLCDDTREFLERK